ncbi:uncharacterized protein LOC142401930 [Odontesthes bonariensis]|uniref:uncharacterized protein LOC142401930 n=1 Tax=Odontesthes bonariensis TaxID=219752 RepID=UPI003F588612
MTGHPLMSVWWQTLFLLGCVLNCMESSAPSSFVQRYNNSFRLTKSTRTRVQQLLRRYKAQQLGNTHFEDRSRQLRDLPFLSTDFNKWLQLSDWDRLHAAFWDVRAYWNMLEGKRKQLENEEKEQTVVQSAPTTLPQSIQHIQLDLRELMSKVSRQVSTVFLLKSTPHFSPFSPTQTLKEVTPKLSGQSTKTLWDSRVEGYIVLRDLDLYLTKLARDFLLLASKTKQK